MGTVLYAKGIYINRCYDELNLSQPEMVRSVHEEYLQAGAEIIETNTFGANPFRLKRYGLEDKVQAINEAGARIARQSVVQLADKQAGTAYVAGSVGPLGIRLEPLGKTSLGEAREAFREQIAALVAGGVDLIIIETMQALDEAEQAILACRDVSPTLPLFAMVTVDEDAACLDGSSPETAAVRLTRAGADAIGANCSLGPATILTAQYLSVLTGIHGQFCETLRQGGGAVYRGLLRDNAEPYPRDEVCSACDGCAESGAGDEGGGFHCVGGEAGTAGGTLADRQADCRGRICHHGRDCFAQGD
jgi:methionine synthase I (cobalamin-dependent)